MYQISLNYREIPPELKQTTKHLPLPPKSKLQQLIDESYSPIISQCDKLAGEFQDQPRNIRTIKDNLQIKLDNIELLTRLPSESLTSVISGPLITKYGAISAITNFMNYLVIGTQKGYIYSINMTELSPTTTYIDQSGQEHKIMVAELISQSIPITNVGVDPIEQVACVGLANGQVLFFNWQKPSKQKITKIHHASIHLVQNLGQQLWLTCDEAGVVYAHRIDKGIFSFDLDTTKLLEQKVNQIQVLKENLQDKFFPESKLKNLTLKVPDHEKEKPYKVVALVSKDKCQIIRILTHNKADILLVIELAHESLPCIEWAHSNESLYLLIAQENVVYQYKLEKFKIEGVHHIAFNLSGCLTVPRISFIQCIHSNVAIYADQDGNIGLVNQREYVELMKVGRYDQIVHSDQLKYFYLWKEGTISIIKEYTFSEIFQRSLESDDITRCEQLLLVAKMVQLDDKYFQPRLLEYLSRKIQYFLRAADQDDFLSNFVDFMLLIEAEDHLFSQVMMTINQFLDDKSVTFRKALKKHINNGHVKFVPRAQLLELIEGLMLEKDIQTLENLLLSLDIERNDQSLMLHYCLENSLTRPLVQLCKTSEFLTPLFQLFQYYHEFKHRGELQKARFFGIRGLSYVLHSLDEISTTDVEMLSLWLFDRDNLEKLLALDDAGTFKVLQRVFTITTERLLEFNHKENLYKQLRCRTLIYSLTKPKNHRSFSLFLLHVCFKLKLQVPDNVKEKTLAFLYRNPDVLFSVESSIFIETTDRTLQSKLSKFNNRHDITQIMHQQLLLQMQTCTIVPGYEDFELICVYHYTNAGQLERAMNKFLGSENKLIKRSVFTWLNDRVNRGQQVMDLIIKRLTDLIKIDLIETRLLVSQKDYEASIIDKLQTYPQLQLDYLDHIMNMERKAGRIPDTSISKQHLQLIVSLAPHRLIDQLKFNDYPLDEVLKMTDDVEAKAYVHERHGAIEKAIAIHSELLTNMMDSVLVKVNNYDEITEYPRINSKINELLDICRRNSQFDSAEDNWYSVLNLFIDQSYRIDKSNPNHSFIFKNLFKRLGQIFEEISIHTSLEIFTSQLKDRYGQLDMFELRDTFLKILFNFAYQRNFIYNIQSFLKEGFTNEFLKCFSLRSRGYFIGSECDFCNEQIQDDRALVYYCGHQMHVKCCNNRCSKCIQLDMDLFNCLNKKKGRPARTESIAGGIPFTAAQLVDKPNPKRNLQRFDEIRSKNKENDYNQIWTL